MKITLKNVKYSDFMSEETLCFEAAVYIDGKKMGVATNEGHGGETRFYPYELQRTINEYAKTLPKLEVKGFEDKETGEPFMLEQDAETIVNGLMEEWLAAKDLKRALSRRVLFQRDGKIMETKSYDAKSLAGILARADLFAQLKSDTVLNLLPFDKALSIYRGVAA